MKKIQGVLNLILTGDDIWINKVPKLMWAIWKYFHCQYPNISIIFAGHIFSISHNHIKYSLLIMLNSRKHFKRVSIIHTYYKNLRTRIRINFWIPVCNLEIVSGKIVANYTSLDWVVLCTIIRACVTPSPPILDYYNRPYTVPTFKFNLETLASDKYSS